ncbi:MAG: hypothetical protein V1755_05615 [Chloroflexota bacterium]
MECYTAYARSVLPDLPENWLVYHVQVLDDESVFMEGAEAYTISKGPRKGRTAWRNPMRCHKMLVMPRDAQP